MRPATAPLTWEFWAAEAHWGTYMSAPTMTPAFSFGSIQRVHWECYTAFSQESTVVSWAIIGSPAPGSLQTAFFAIFCNLVTMLVVVVQKAHWKKHCSILLSIQGPRPRKMLCAGGSRRVLYVFKALDSLDPHAFQFVPCLHMTGLTGLDPSNCTKMRSTNPAITIVYWLNAIACVFQQVRRKEA